MKKQYIIRFKGLLFEQGYVKVLIWPRKPKNKTYSSKQECINACTKFKFKILAEFCCYIFNRISKNTYEFREYYVDIIRA